MSGPFSLAAAAARYTKRKRRANRLRPATGRAGEGPQWGNAIKLSAPKEPRYRAGR